MCHFIIMTGRARTAGKSKEVSRLKGKLRSGKLPHILIVENVELRGMAWYTVNIVVND